MFRQYVDRRCSFIKLLLDGQTVLMIATFLATVQGNGEWSTEGVFLERLGIPLSHSFLPQYKIHRRQRNTVTIETTSQLEIDRAFGVLKRRFSCLAKATDIS